MKATVVTIAIILQSFLVAGGNTQPVNVQQSSQHISAIELLYAELLANSGVAASFVYENTSENDIYAEMMFGFSDYKDDAKSINLGDDAYKPKYYGDNVNQITLSYIFFAADNEEITPQRVELIRWRDIKTHNSCTNPRQCEALKTVMFKWQQHFPAGKKVKITYNYPDFGRVEDGEPTKFADQIIRKNEKFSPYCVEQNIAKSLERIAKGKENISTRLSFIGPFLSPSGPWADKLARQQRIIVNKPPTHPDLKNQEMVSFCGNNVKKVSDRQFQLDFTKEAFQHSFRLLTIHTFWW